ncbi:MAG: DUF4270 domain-containing protein, partial [Muribaculaceae bacterium]|nr:DUF4270 domain-containing protein [Muribaculaceae bacterium]
MNLRTFTLAAGIPILAAMALASCEDEIPKTGTSLFPNDVEINIDSMTVALTARCVDANEIDARSTTTQIGHLDMEGFGDLSAAYVTQFLAASALSVPDSIGIDRVDSTKLVISMPRSEVIGDTLAPQQLTVYRLTRALPANIRSDFNPDGYYDAANPVNSKNYTLSGLNLSDSLFSKVTTLTVNVDLPVEWGRDAFTAYRENASIFQWPNTFCEKFPGMYIKPSFGRGAMANVSSTKVMIYYHYLSETTVVENEESVKKQITVKDSVALFSSAPEVLSSTIFKYTPATSLADMIAAGKKIITAPLGHTVEFTFPTDELLDSYWTSDQNLSVINNLTLTLPAAPISNNYGIVPPSDLLLILKKDVEDFFANGKVPDNKTSFLGSYSSTNGRYEFSSMREYIVDLKDNRNALTPDDVDFVLI